MKDLVRENLERIYKNKDLEFYKSQCSKPIALPESFFVLLDQPELYTSKDALKTKIWPAKKWLVKFPKFNISEFESSFDTEILISKVAPLFYVEHAFQVKNKAPRKIEPSLTGSCSEGCIIPQYDFHSELSKILSDYGYLELDYADINEVIPELYFPEGVTIFGPQVTVEYALFHDLLDLCPDDDAE
jgi:hypothetical protein